MKDYLQDILRHTHKLGLFEFIKVTGTDTETKVDALSEDKNAILMATMHNPVLDFKGTFGMPNLGKMAMLLDCSEYQENADISLQHEMRNGVNTPVSIKFVNEAKDFKNEYRLMNQSVIEEKLKTINFNSPKWDVEFQPNIAGIQRLSFQTGLLNEEANFTFENNKGNLLCRIGDAANHAGQFVFASNIVGKVDVNMAWPVKYFLPILKLYDNSSTFKIKISSAGLMEISVDSGLAVYNFYILAAAR